MALELTGKVVHILPEQSGTGRNGQWVKQDFIIETQEQYPRKVCFAAWGDKAELVKNLNPGMSISVSFNAESREYNGKWYTDLKVWKIEQQEQHDLSQGSPQPAPSDVHSYDTLEPLSPGESTAEPDDLPF
jgi:hypothetical protein